MRYTDYNIVKNIFIKYPDLIEDGKGEKYQHSIVVNNYIYLSCHILTDTPRDYLVIYEPDSNKENLSLISPILKAFSI